MCVWCCVFLLQVDALEPALAALERNVKDKKDALTAVGSALQARHVLCAVCSPLALLCASACVYVFLCVLCLHRLPSTVPQLPPK